MKIRRATLPISSFAAMALVLIAATIAPLAMLAGHI
jgi:hypothetical protein